MNFILNNSGPKSCESLTQQLSSRQGPMLTGSFRREAAFVPRGAKPWLAKHTHKTSSNQERKYLLRSVSLLFVLCPPTHIDPRVPPPTVIQPKADCFRYAPPPPQLPRTQDFPRTITPSTALSFTKHCIFCSTNLPPIPPHTLRSSGVWMV